jgi:hypothetical protein
MFLEDKDLGSDGRCRCVVLINTRTDRVGRPSLDEKMRFDACGSTLCLKLFLSELEGYMDLYASM